MKSVIILFICFFSQVSVAQIKWKENYLNRVKQSFRDNLKAIKMPVNEEPEETIHLVNEKIDNLPDLFEFSVYPVPANDHITVISNKSGMFTLFDMLGNLMISEQVHMSQTFDLSLFPDGVYILRFKSSEGDITTKKILIRH